VGKTVLLRRFQEIAESDGWATISVEIEPRHASDAAFASLVRSQAEKLDSKLSVTARIKDAAGAAINAARRVVNVKYEGFEWSLAGDLDVSTKAVAEMILEASDKAVNNGKAGLVILFDEAQILADENDPNGNHPLSALIAAVSTLQKQGSLVSLVLCGLPTLAVNLLSARTYTERMFQGFRIDSLDDTASKEALVNPLAGTTITANPKLVERIVNDVDGYPYFLQLWGAELWDATVDAGGTEMTASTLDVIEPGIQKRLDLDFYEPRIESLTPAEQDLLLESAACAYPPLRVAELNDASKKTPGNINVLLGRLVKSNVLYRPRKGEYRYTAPKFRDFLLRRIASVESER
jgi:hypothetical protein